MGNGWPAKRCWRRTWSFWASLMVLAALWAVVGLRSGSPGRRRGDKRSGPGQRGAIESRTPIRMYGIDAPETHQTCRTETQTYRCGRDATTALAETDCPS